jgi:hypothetical protein
MSCICPGLTRLDPCRCSIQGISQSTLVVRFLHNGRFLTLLSDPGEYVQTYINIKYIEIVKEALQGVKGYIATGVVSGPYRSLENFRF